MSRIRWRRQALYLYSG